MSAKATWWRSGAPECVQMSKANKQTNKTKKVLDIEPHLHTSQLAAFFFYFIHFPLICSLWSLTGAPLAQDNNHISDPSRLAAERWMYKLDGGDRIITLCELTQQLPLHIRAQSDAGNFPRWNCATARHDRWLLYSKSSPPSDPEAIYFCQHKNTPAQFFFFHSFSFIHLQTLQVFHKQKVKRVPCSLKFSI